MGYRVIAGLLPTLACGLMSRPRLLLLDEPSLGLSPTLVSESFRLVTTLRARGIAILLLEQNARQSLAIADRAYVLENGRITITADPPTPWAPRT